MGNASWRSFVSVSRARGKGRSMGVCQVSTLVLPSWYLRYSSSTSRPVLAVVRCTCFVLVGAALRRHCVEAGRHRSVGVPRRTSAGWPDVVGMSDSVRAIITLVGMASETSVRTPSVVCARNRCYVASGSNGRRRVVGRRSGGRGLRPLTGAPSPPVRPAAVDDAGLGVDAFDTCKTFLYV